VIGLGTIVNVAAIVAGGCLGTFLRGGLKEHYQTALTRTLGLATMFIGISGSLPGMLEVVDGQFVGKDTLGMVLALAFGTLIGEFLDFDGLLERLGRWLKERAARGDDSRFVEGFVTASLVVCVGAMAIVGSIQDGLTGNPATLYTKSILDFTIVMVFASTYGRGAIFSALPVGVLRGSVTLLAGLVAPLFTPAIIANLSFLGSVLIFCVGINLVFDSRFRVANMLPALVLGGIYTALF